LESGTVTEITLDALHSQRITFGKDTIPTAEVLSGNYYEQTDDDTFPAIDSLSYQGMFHFTVAAEHPIPIRGAFIHFLIEFYNEVLRNQLIIIGQYKTRFESIGALYRIKR
jgi:hypothetical protein